MTAYVIKPKLLLSIFGSVVTRSPEICIQVLISADSMSYAGHVPPGAVGSLVVTVMSASTVLEGPCEGGLDGATEGARLGTFDGARLGTSEAVMEGLELGISLGAAYALVMVSSTSLDTPIDPPL